MFDGSHCRDEELGFPDFLKDNRETNCCVPLQIYYTILHCSSGMVATVHFFSKIQVIVCLKLLRARTICVGFSSSLNTHAVDCCLHVLVDIDILRANQKYPIFRLITEISETNSYRQLYYSYRKTVFYIKITKGGDSRQL